MSSEYLYNRMRGIVGIKDVRLVGGVADGDHKVQITFNSGFEAIILIPDDLEEFAGTSPDCIGLNLITLGHYK